MPHLTIGELKIHYTLTSQGPETLLIFSDNLHCAATHEREITHWADAYQVLAFDYPGSGQSSHEGRYPDELAVDYFGFRADLACHLLLDLNIDACHVLATGGGVMAALHFAGKQAPQHNLHTISLLADSCMADFDARTLHRWLDVREHYYVRNGRNLHTWHGENWRTLLDEDTRFLRQLADRGGYAVPNKIINNITCPTLLIGHLQDPALPDLAQEYVRLSNLIPDCSLYLSGKANHPHLERPFMWTDAQTFRTITDLFWSRHMKTEGHG
jgi:pimeloyl-ACP methyl ester carboxylesterase